MDEERYRTMIDHEAVAHARRKPWPAPGSTRRVTIDDSAARRDIHREAGDARPVTGPVTTGQADDPDDTGFFGRRTATQAKPSPSTSDAHPTHFAIPSIAPIAQGLAAARDLNDPDDGGA